MSLFSGDLFTGEIFDGEYFRGGAVILSVEYLDLNLAEMYPVGPRELRGPSLVEIAPVGIKEVLA